MSNVLKVRPPICSQNMMSTAQFAYQDTGEISMRDYESTSQDVECIESQVLIQSQIMMIMDHFAHQ